MIIRLLGADFSASNIGTVGNFTISYEGDIFSGSPHFIERDNNGIHAGRDFEGTISMNSGYAYKSMEIKIGNTVLSEDEYFVEASESDVKVTIHASKINDNVTITVVGEFKEGDDVEYVEYTSFDGFERYNGFIGSSGAWNNINEKYEHIVIPINGESTLSVTAMESESNSQIVYLAGVQSYIAPVSGETLNYSTDSEWSKRISVGLGKTKTFNPLPSDVKYLIVFVRYNNTEVTPSNFIVRTQKPKNNE